jgi:prolyl-tRNA synthetase
MRWEMRTRLFLRTSEFLWQEGHNAFADAEGARNDAIRMLEVYNTLYTDWLAIAGIAGEKTPDERFPGANVTLSIEAMMQDGKALQACTSHDLGQNFAKSCNIQFQGEDGQQHFAHTTSWGLSTRSIGGLIMVHADDDGMIMPPKVAPHQIAIIPVLRDDAGKGELMAFCQGVASQLKASGLRVHLDASDARTPDKMWACVKKGVPLRVEIGQREMAEGQLTFIRRDLGKDSKKTVAVDEFIKTASGILSTIQGDMLARSRSFTDSHIFDVQDVKGVRDMFASGTVGFARAPVAVLKDDTLDAVKKEYSLTPRCLPFADEGRFVLIGKSY